MKPTILRLALALSALAILAAAFAFSPQDQGVPNPFRQLGAELPTPNVYRTASGAPGHQYWQQQVDYRIEVRLDEENKHLHGMERITYHNQSPDTLTYLWVALDPNIFSPESHAVKTALAPDLDRPSYRNVQRVLARQAFDGSCQITAVRDGAGQDLEKHISDTMMRVDLPTPLATGQSFVFDIHWDYAINNSKEVGGRTGYEMFEEDGNAIFEMAQWFPRLCAYTDSDGWQNLPFLGRGEFTLEFGNYDVSITVPDDHVVASTGVLEDAGDVLKPEWIERLAHAKDTGELTLIVTPDEAKVNESSEPQGMKTWTFTAENVRDFAWASSRKFAWDALYHPVEGTDPVWAMSFFPCEGEPLWSRYSTRAVAHTLTEYSRLTFPYPYPVAISVNGPVGGMEYPMICFNGPRPEKDGTYSKRTKYGLISVIIHEVGHNWFPMIVNSDERQWTWMDEGLNTYCQFLTEQSWEEDYPSWRGEARNIVGYMRSDRQRPIMTGSEEVLQFGSNAYAKPATALNILRETVVGRELFDFAFQQYAQRWKFKRPQPADLFRTLEDASAVDLDWFWRGWFFSVDACDQSLTGLTRYRIESKDPNIAKARRREVREQEPESITQLRNRGLSRVLDTYPGLADFYNDFDDLDVTPQDLEAYEAFLNNKKIEAKDRALHANTDNFYVVEIRRERDLIMPVILEVHYTDGSPEIIRWPARVWNDGRATIQKLLITQREIDRLVLDPHWETADVALANNHWPRRVEEKAIDLQPNRRRGGGGPNPMQEARDAQEKADQQAADEDETEEAEGSSPADAPSESND